MKVIKVVVDEMPSTCDDCPLKSARPKWDCGKEVIILAGFTNRVARVPDHRCLCVVEGAKK